MTVGDYRCTARRGEAPFLEQHGEFSVSYVRKGTFAYHTRGKSYELVPGSIMLGHAGDEFSCSHEHMAGDECLSVAVSGELAETLSAAAAWRRGVLPPIAELVVLGQLAEASSSGPGELGLDETAALLTARALQIAADRPAASGVRIGSRERRLMVGVAMWIDENCHERIGLEQAATEAGYSLYHFLRMFRAVLGGTPHQHLVRCRMRRAARLLAEEDLPVTDVALTVGFHDLSNFVRTFRRAAGVPPRSFRRAVVQGTAPPAL